MIPPQIAGQPRLKIDCNSPTRASGRLLVLATPALPQRVPHRDFFSAGLCRRLNNHHALADKPVLEVSQNPIQHRSFWAKASPPSRPPLVASPVLCLPPPSYRPAKPDFLSTTVREPQPLFQQALSVLPASDLPHPRPCCASLPKPCDYCLCTSQSYEEISSWPG